MLFVYNLININDFKIVVVSDKCFIEVLEILKWKKKYFLIMFFYYFFDIVCIMIEI